MWSGKLAGRTCWIYWKLAFVWTQRGDSIPSLGHAALGTCLMLQDAGFRRFPSPAPCIVPSYGAPTAPTRRSRLAGGSPRWECLLSFLQLARWLALSSLTLSLSLSLAPCLPACFSVCDSVCPTVSFFIPSVVPSFLSSLMPYQPQQTKAFLHLPNIHIQEHLTYRP